MAHADDLRAEVAEEALVDAVQNDYRRAPLTEADRRMLDFAVKLTREPRSMTREDVEALRAVGFDDTAIHDVVQITGFFAYYNRLADGLGIEPET
ncbi:MAG TPA: peroxidase-related enzyme [Thermoanaerobaculia bacterium]|nr:peroxidase-related enzyme [Thermoanaerobaculia bacterium]